MDKDKKAVEDLIVTGYDHSYEVEDPDYEFTERHVKLGREGEAVAQTHGVGSDNPTNPFTLTPLQERRSIGFAFTDTSKFEVTYGTKCDGKKSKGGRNFLFGLYKMSQPLFGPTEAPTPAPCGPGTGFASLDMAKTDVTKGLASQEGTMTYGGIGELDGEPVDLVVSVADGETYEAANADNNGKKGDFGQINMKTCTTATFDFQFQKGGAALTMKRFDVTFFDIDQNKPGVGVEVMATTGYESVHPLTESDGSTPLERDYKWDEGTGTATAKSNGVGADNPSDAMDLSKLQRSRSVGFHFVDTASFKVTFGSECTGTSKGGRNFRFAFQSAIIPCKE
jgi:hypothetical protein